MSGFTIEIDQVSSAEFLNFIRIFPQKFDDMNEISLRRIGEEIQGEAGTRAPYLSGTLRRSLQNKQSFGSVWKEKKESNGRSLEVGSNLKYAARQENAHRTKSRFLGNAIDRQANGKAQDIFSQEIDTMFKKP